MGLTFKLIAAIGAMALTACVPPTITLPVVGKLSNDETAQGSILLDLATEVGSFDVVTLSGLSCSGTYDASIMRSTITIPIACNNGQTGVVIATRDATGVAGTATAQLQDGMSGQFLFGNISAEMQAQFLD